MKNAIERNHELHEKIVGIESADQLTENQIIARVKDYFSSEEFKAQKQLKRKEAAS